MLAKIENYETLKAGTILQHRFTETKIRYIFVRITERNELELIPIYTKRNDGTKWETPLFGLFAIAAESEQIIGDYSTFNLAQFLEYSNAEKI